MLINGFGMFILAFVLLLQITGINISTAQVFRENTDEKYSYNLRGYRFLILLGEDFDYHESMVIKKYWEDWGAKVDIAGTGKELKGHLWKKTDKGWDKSEEKTIKTDLLTSQVDLSKYNLIFFPGGNSPKNLLEKDSSLLMRLIQEAEKKGLILSAICHGPLALASAGVLKGHRVTGHYEIMKNIQEGGGEYVTGVCVVDGNVITGNWPYFESMAVKTAEKLLYPQGGGPSENSPFEQNPVLKVIKERRSIRRFQDKEVSQDTINILLKSATWAPSPNNDQPWRFVVLKDKKIKEMIVNAIMEKLSEYYKSEEMPLDRMKQYISGIFSAPVHIFALCDDSNIEEEEWKDIQMLWNMQAVSAGCQNILLAARGMGLGSLWIGLSLVAEDEIKSLLQIPAEIKLASVIAIGYPADVPLPPLRKPLSEVISLEKWGKR
ncbi:MAG: nitroreductase family protein [candidate division Zixibacteria bacterium]|nr:nitroreductase family protein [candidate division Zixibacteria bacterium]